MNSTRPLLGRPPLTEDRSSRARYILPPKFQSSLRFQLASMLIVLLMLSTPAVGAIPAFPGAEGGGALSVGGRGGVVCEVTNLNDDGLGSLRACIDRTGPRVVVFRVAGTIWLTSRLMITNPYITIAGQTAPGDGIQIGGKNVDGTTNLVQIYATHDVVIRHLRIRNGRRATQNPDATTISIRNSHNVILDHVSLMWAEGTNFTVWGGGHNITLQNSIVAEALNTYNEDGSVKDHRVNILTGGNDHSQIMGMVDIDFHKNLISTSSHRNPLLKTRRNRFVNNLVYNWRLPSESGGAAHHDYINNLYKFGPVPRRSASTREIRVHVWDEDACNNRLAVGNPSIYAAGNFGPYSGSDNTTIVHRINCENGSHVSELPKDWRRSTPLDPVGVPITVHPSADIEEMVLPVVGASRRLDCEGNWVFIRDEADSRVVDNYRRNRGVLIGSEEEVGGFPQLKQGTACVDSSGDGIPDEWLITKGFDPKLRVGETLHVSGYTYLEMYLNGPTQPSPRAPTIMNVQ